MVRGSEESEHSDNMAGLLDRYDEMQRRPFGSNTALSAGNTNNLGGVAGSQFRRQEAAYGQALRTLNRAARRGDARAALGAIDVREQAMEAGFAPGGIRRSEIANAGIRGQVAGMEQAATERAKQSRILQMQAEESMRNAGDMTEESMGTSEERRRVAEEQKRTEGQQTASTGTTGGAAETKPAATAGTAATAARPRVPMPTATYSTSGGDYTGRTPTPTPAAQAATSAPPTEKTAAQKYAEAQERYQKYLTGVEDTQGAYSQQGVPNTDNFAEMNRIYSGADSQGQADIVAQSLKRAAGLNRFDTAGAPRASRIIKEVSKSDTTKRTSRTNLRK